MRACVGARPFGASMTNLLPGRVLCSALFGLWCRSEETMEQQQTLSAADKAKMDAGVKFGMDMLKQLPKGTDSVVLEAHITGVLIAFWGALWGTFGTEYARGFIEAQLRGMEPDQPHERFTPPRVQ